MRFLFSQAIFIKPNVGYVKVPLHTLIMFLLQENCTYILINDTSRNISFSGRVGHFKLQCGQEESTTTTTKKPLLKRTL